jgi:(1->4)-alpha-D-glucan 1-alpha-D-glucosylmutase
VLGFVRGDRVVTVVPRSSARLGGDWHDTTLVLPPGAWRNVLTGESVVGGDVRVGSSLRRFPTALLVREDDGP